MKKSAQFGVTLIELMVVIALIAAFTTMGLPALQDFLSNSRLRSHTNDIVVALQRARNEAIEKRTQLGVHVTAELRANGDVERFIIWSDGGIDPDNVADTAGDGTADGNIDGTIETSVEVLQIFNIQPSVNVQLFGYNASVSLASESNINNAMEARTLSFRSDGSLRINANVAQISLSDHRSGVGRCLNIRMTGQVSLRNPTTPCS
ncbi:MAG: GspH/FimT family pseudopilin [Pseudomonadota bacterium]